MALKRSGGGLPWREVFFVSLAFLLLGLWKYGPALFDSHLSLTNSGDGIGTIGGGIFAIVEKWHAEGWPFVLQGRFSSENIGLGIIEPNEMNYFWKLNYILLGSFFSPDNVYDVNGLLGFFLEGVLGYGLFRYLGAARAVSLLSALLMTHLDVVYARLTGHLLGLGIFYAPLFMIWMTVRAGRKPSLSRLLVLGAAHAVNFIVNEYYGFYGFFFSAVLLVGYLCFLKPEWPGWRKFGGGLIAAGVCFVGLMAIFYPYLVGAKILALFQGKGASKGGAIIDHGAHDWGAFVAFATRNSRYLFAPNIGWLYRLFPSHYFDEGSFEFSYRMGTLVPAFGVIPLFLSLFSRAQNVVREEVNLRRQAWVWFASGFVLALFGITPLKKVSLVHLTFKIAPMFRVGVRSFMYTNIALIVVFALVVSVFWNRLPSWKTLKRFSAFQRRVAVGGLFVAFGLCLFKDLSISWPWEHMPVLDLPDTRSYKVLRDRPAGLLMELPIFVQGMNVPEDNYLYVYARTAHLKPLVNIPWGNGPANPALFVLSALGNAPTKEHLEHLRQFGLRYVVLHKDYAIPVYRAFQGYDFSPLDQSPMLRKLSESERIAIYEFVRPLESKGVSQFREALLSYMNSKH